METGILILTAIAAGAALFCLFQMMAVNRRLARLEAQDFNKKLSTLQATLAEQGHRTPCG